MGIAFGFMKKTNFKTCGAWIFVSLGRYGNEKITAKVCCFLFSPEDVENIEFMKLWKVFSNYTRQ